MHQSGMRAHRTCSVKPALRAVNLGSSSSSARGQVVGSGGGPASSAVPSVVALSSSTWPPGWKSEMTRAMARATAIPHMTDRVAMANSVCTAWVTCCCRAGGAVLLPERPTPAGDLLDDGSGHAEPGERVGEPVHEDGGQQRAEDGEAQAGADDELPVPLGILARTPRHRQESDTLARVTIRRRGRLRRGLRPLRTSRRSPAGCVCGCRRSR